MLRRLIDIILILTLIFQLLPANKAGRSFLFDLSDDDYSDSCTCKAQFPQLEEESKWVDAHYNLVNVPCKDVQVSLFHFSENLPVPHAEAITTPPPDAVA